VATLGYGWTAADPAVDVLQGRLAALVEAAQAEGADPASIFEAVSGAIRAAAGVGEGRRPGRGRGTGRG
jgi:hypothetical protein